MSSFTIRTRAGRPRTHCPHCGAFAGKGATVCPNCDEVLEGRSPDRNQTEREGSGADAQSAPRPPEQTSATYEHNGQTFRLPYKQ